MLIATPPAARTRAEVMPRRMRYLIDKLQYLQ